MAPTTTASHCQNQEASVRQGGAYEVFQHWKHNEAHRHPQDLSRIQDLLTEQRHNVLATVLGGILNNKDWFDEVYEHVIRVDFYRLLLR